MLAVNTPDWRKVIWVHSGCLHWQNPAFWAYPGAPSVFVWDEAELRRAQWSLKRIGFVHECLLDLPVEIRKGDPVIAVREFAAMLGCSDIVTVASEDPHIQAQAIALNAEVLPLGQFIAKTEGRLPTSRFSRHWPSIENAKRGLE